jgi:hypothetical protein
MGERVTFSLAGSYPQRPVKILIASGVLIAAALALSGCGGSHSATTLPPSLVKQLAAEARGLTKGLGDPSVKTAEVYGPDSRSALVQASSGAVIPRTGDRKRFYLIVVQGNFVCDSCRGPAGSKPPKGTIATSVWSIKAGHSTDFGLSHTLPRAMSTLGRPAVISLG